MTSNVMNYGFPSKTSSNPLTSVWSSKKNTQNEKPLVLESFKFTPWSEAKYRFAIAWWSSNKHGRGTFNRSLYEKFLKARLTFNLSDE